MRCTAMLLVMLLMSVGVAAQERPDPTSPANLRKLEVRTTVAVGQYYLDESFPDHYEAGLSTRIFLTPRIAIEPEFSFLQSNVDYLPNEHKYALIMSVVGTFGDQGKRLQPYWTAGAGARFGGQANDQLELCGGVGIDYFFSNKLFKFVRLTESTMIVEANDDVAGAATDLSIGSLDDSGAVRPFEGPGHSGTVKLTRNRRETRAP